MRGVRTTRLVLWAGALFFGALGLLVLDATQRLQGREQAGDVLFVPAQTVVALFADGVTGVAGTVGEIGQLRQENRRLVAQNQDLQARNLQAEQALLENAQLKSLLGFQRQHATHTYQPARVIGYGSNNLLPMVTLDQGGASGIKPGMAVVASGGLLGRVLRVGPRWSHVLPITNPSSSVAVAISGTDGPATGILQTEPDQGLGLSLVPATARLQTGAWVLTSGTGGGFPPNIPVGVIISSRQQDVALFQTALVQPAVDVARVQDVLVMTDFVPINVPAGQ